ncbi:AI-2E family transporter [Lacrimispora amygdalina]|uniref:AI-2E family transporter n=1 Tax=Lacrimispora amygdalina TaxID=253257 RepID=A0A3E2NAZ0_9FIRM|nr:AI-2E family transporter [Clostridium indicum]RFZ78156.1 AI-2E family transporter [Clostridium indicum]
MELNDSTIKKIRWLIVFTVVAVVAGINYRSLFALLVRAVAILTPFLLGGVMAFVLNVPMRAIEGILPVKKESQFRRPLSLCLTFLFVIGILLLVIFVVMPQLFDTVLSLQYSLPVFWNGVKAEAEKLFFQYPEIADYINNIHIDWKSYLEKIVQFLSVGAGTVLSSTISAALSIISGVTTFAIGLVFAVYILLQKENLSRQMKKLMKAFLPDHASERILEILSLASRTFSNFLAGQCVEAVILGSMFFITLSILRLPYALLIGVLIAFTALVPMFGAFIGCAIGAFLMLMVKPFDAALFLIIFFVLQQIEGNLIYPHVVGNSVGLPAIWVLVAVTIGGSAMGIVGMLIFIPLCSVFYAVLRETVNKRIWAKERLKRRKTVKQ